MMLRNTYSLLAAVLWICQLCQGISAFSVPQPHARFSVITSPSQTSVSSVQLSAHYNDDASTLSSRREWTKRAFATLIATSSVSAAGSASADSGDTIWKTGKAPIVPGQTPKDKSDTKGTRKDPAFLRSISDCKGKCEQTPGPDGLARASTECLSECQDICCTTYEQCTFAIVPR